MLTRQQPRLARPPAMPRAAPTSFSRPLVAQRVDAQAAPDVAPHAAHMGDPTHDDDSADDDRQPHVLALLVKLSRLGTFASIWRVRVSTHVAHTPLIGAAPPHRIGRRTRILRQWSRRTCRPSKGMNTGREMARRSCTHDTCMDASSQAHATVTPPAPPTCILEQGGTAAGQRHCAQAGRGYSDSGGTKADGSSDGGDWVVTVCVAICDGSSVRTHSHMTSDATDTCGRGGTSEAEPAEAAATMATAGAIARKAVVAWTRVSQQRERQLPHEWRWCE